MNRRISFILTVLGGVLGLAVATSQGASKTRLVLPEFERTPEQLSTGMAQAIKAAEIRLERVGELSGKPTFENTLGELDQMYFEVIQAANRAWVIKATSTDEKMRDAATEAIKVFDEWSVGLDYREDVYRSVKAFSDSKHRLKGERLKLLEDSMRDYKRAGLALSKEARDEVEALRKKLSKLETDFSSNITKIQVPLTFRAEELKGVPASFLESDGLKTGDNEYTVLANVTFHYLMVMENCSVESTRRKMHHTRFTLAKDENSKLLQEIVELRNTIAGKLGYDTWADYKTEPKMAKTGKAALEFVTELKEGLEPKFRTELESFRKLKAQETGDPDAKLHVWDWRYFDVQLKKTKYSVDTEAMRAYFPFQETLEGMFRIYEQCFGLKIKQVDAPYKWVEELTLHLISDSKSGKPLGYVYLDMFPREGKYNHFAQFDLIPGKKLEDGAYHCPVAALICNFPPPSGDKPSLLSHNEVETLFHEFGHALHTILTTAETATLSGTNVPRDFVEAPSQMLERWVWEKDVLDRFAGDYRDRSKKIPADLLAKMEEARLATIATFYRRQLAFGTLDLVLHTEVGEGKGVDVIQRSNEVLSEVFLPVPEDTSFVTFFGHLMGYDAGYYGYAWADAIAADLATEFKKAPRKFMNQKVGMKLRSQIYAPGGSRDVEVSIRKFLGRKRSIEPFLESIGIGGK